jgi:hypothetical protein
MYQVLIYRITLGLWRWEIRCGGALVRCGTAGSEAGAYSEAHEIVVG